MLFTHSPVGAELPQTSQADGSGGGKHHSNFRSSPDLSGYTQETSIPEKATAHPTEIDIFWKTGSFKTSGQFPVHISVETCYEKCIKPGDSLKYIICNTPFQRLPDLTIDSKIILHITFLLCYIVLPFTQSVSSNWKATAKSQAILY